MHSRVSLTLWRFAKLLIALAAAPFVAHGQLASDIAVRPGTPMLVYVRDEPVREGVYDGFSASELRLRGECAGCTAATSVHWADIARADALVPGGPSAIRMVAGGLIGAAGTVVLLIGTGLVTNELAPCHWDGGSCPAIGLVTAAPVLIGFGTGIGVIAGFRHRPKRWVTVWPRSGMSDATTSPR